MDPEIWSELLDHIIYKILALLPIRDFLRLRWVCRRWSRLMESPVFLDEFSQSKVERPWFAIVADARKVYVYQPHSEIWYNMPASFLQPNSVFLGTSKGLILSRLSRRASGLHYLLVVSNPFTGSQRILPQQTLFGCGYAMVVDEATKAYTVYHFGQIEPFLDGLVANPHEDEHTFEAFSSTTNLWQVLSRINPEIFAGLPSYAFDDAKLLVGDDYIICRLRGYFGVFAYSLTRRGWLQIPWVVRPNICAFQQLLCSQDRLIMVVGIKKNMDADSGCESIHLHQLLHGTLEWSEVAIVPSENDDPYSLDTPDTTSEDIINEDQLDKVVQNTIEDVLLHPQEDIRDKNSFLERASIISETPEVVHTYTVGQRIKLLHPNEDIVVAIATITSKVGIGQMHNRLQPKGIIRF